MAADILCVQVGFFRFRNDTDLFEIVKCKTSASAIEVSPNGKQFSTTSPDRRIRVFWFRTSTLRRVYNESLEVAQVLKISDAPLYQLEVIDFGRRMAVENKKCTATKCNFRRKL
ncbi:hypothetical protein Patl1_29705 [Pistacia atlantica]|uniref:Uncharacterized protein n=1 Tax=Pistacia atlantica TaxID=434234 RepID=A0ACC1ADS4_9ROSI|nr:hypothetical protein Patl1_29705 [Pistacia atlantica]